MGSPLWRSLAVGFDGRVSKRVWHSTLGLALIASVAACGGGDDEPAAAPAESEEPADDGGSDTTDAAEPADEGGSGVLAASQSCLESVGMTVTAPDESNTGMNDEMRANLGIVDMVVWEKGAGWGGTVEEYGSSEQADIAESGYTESDWGYEVGRVDDIVFRSTGPADDIVDITTCLESNQ